MRIMVDGRRVNSGRPVPVGVQTDEKALTLEFDGLPALAAGQVVTIHFGDAVTLTKNGETGWYEFVVDTDVTTREQDVILAYLQIDTGSVVWHSETFQMDLHLLPDLDAEYIARNGTLLDTILAGEASRTTAEAAREAAAEAYLSHPTKTVNGVVQVWDSENETYTDGEDLVAAILNALPTAVGVSF